MSSHEHRSLSCESCDSLSVFAVEQQLRQMQQQLNEISVIPMQIQATLSFLTKTLSKFAPPELQMQLPEALRGATGGEQAEAASDSEESTSTTGAIDGDDEQPVDADAEEREEYAITLESLFDESQVLPVLPTAGNDEDGEYVQGEEEAEPEISEEERSRIEKLERIIKLQKTWPWSQQEKPIHKRSNCHLVPSVALERSKIKQIADMGSLPFYKHGYLTRV